MSYLVLIALGVIMILTSSIPEKDGEILWEYASGSFFIGILIVLFGLYLGVSSA